MQKNEAGFTAIEREQFRNNEDMRECIACTGSGTSSAGSTCRGCSGTGAQKEAEDIAHHSSKSVEHYTPAPIVDAARAVLGEIDLDPASCLLAQDVVKASAWYGPGSHLGGDGLSEPWMGRVFLNPPGGRVPEEWKGCGTTSNAALWWGKLAASWQAGEVDAAIFIGFTLEILRSAQALDVPQPLDFPLCVPSSRIAFDTIDDHIPYERISSKQPTHANVIIFLPPIGDAGSGSPNIKLFAEHFNAIGRCRV